MAEPFAGREGEPMNRFPRVLAIGAHPDDVEIGMGGAVLAMREEGYEVWILDLTDGEPTPMGTPERRREEAAAAAEILGAKRITLPLKNRELADTVEARRMVAEVIREVRPEFLFIHYWDDAHPDHVAACRLSEAGRFYAKLTKAGLAGEPWYPRKVFHFAAIHYRLHLEPSFILDISPYMERKLEAIRCYTSQFNVERGNLGLLEEVREENRYWGSLIGCAYGEPFACKEEIGLKGMGALV